LFVTVIHSRYVNVGQSIWDKLFRAVLTLLVIAAVLAVILWYQPVIQQNQRMRQEKLALDLGIEKENETARKLDAALHAFQNPTTIERLARERLSYAKPGEEVIHFDPPPGARSE
jgi:cell division protein FtsB